MRRGEAWNLKWTDIDFVNATVSVTPKKHSKPRMFKISNKLLAILAIMQKNRNNYSEIITSKALLIHLSDREKEPH